MDLYGARKAQGHSSVYVGTYHTPGPVSSCKPRPVSPEAHMVTPTGATFQGQPVLPGPVQIVPRFPSHTGAGDHSFPQTAAAQLGHLHPSKTGCEGFQAKARKARGVQLNRRDPHKSLPGGSKFSSIPPSARAEEPGPPCAAVPSPALLPQQK